MKLQSPTLILVFIAIALGSFVAVTELRSADSGDGGESQSLFEFEEEEVKTLVVETASQTLTFAKTDSSEERSESSISEWDTEDASTSGVDISPEDKEDSDAQSKEVDAESEDDSASNDADGDSPDVSSDSGDTDEAKAEATDQISTEEEKPIDDTEAEAIESDIIASEWWMRSPEDSPADDSAVIFLVNLMASGVSDRVFDVAPENLDDFGFDTPLAEVEVTLENDESHRLILGNYDFNGTNIYAQAISSNEESNTAEGDGPETTEGETVDVFIVSTSFDSAVNRPLDEWKQENEETVEDASNAPEDKEENPSGS